MSSDLVTLRTKYGFDSPIGHRCSSLLEGLECYGKETDRTARVNILAGIERNKAKLKELLHGRCYSTAPHCFV